MSTSGHQKGKRPFFSQHFHLNFRSFKAYLLKSTQHRGSGEDNHSPNVFPIATRTIGKLTSILAGHDPVVKSCAGKPQVKVVEMKEPGALRRQLIFLRGPKEIAPGDWGWGCMVTAKATLFLHVSLPESRRRKDCDTEGSPQPVPGALQKDPSC